MDNFYLTQTSLKDLEVEYTCPFRWKKQWIDKEFQLPSNDAMERGKYFEQIVLGSGAITGDQVTDLTRLKSGDKSTDQKRIEEQAKRAHGMLYDPNHPEYLGLIVNRTQLELVVDDDKGTLDIEAFDVDGIPWIVDLKLTADLTSDRTPYSWGNDWQNMDLIQLPHYGDLYFKKYGVFPKLGILVLDYSTKKRATFGELLLSQNKLDEKTYRFKTGHLVIDKYNETEWIKIPSKDECSKCPLTCDLRINESNLIRKIINY